MKKISEQLQRASSPIQEVATPLLDESGLRLLVKRDDLLDPDISGNKWRKLKYNLLEARRSGCSRLLTFGGAYSNHLAAVAAAGREFGFSTMGIVRGEMCEPLNPTLSFVKACGMELLYVSRAKFRQKNVNSILEELKIDTKGMYLLPEGGTNCLAIRGCKEIIVEAEAQSGMLPDYVSTACGTGGTLAGITAGLQGLSEALGIAVLKGGFLANDVGVLLKRCGEPNYPNWKVIDGYHFGGYAKFKPELLSFMHRFTAQTGIPLDPIYTGKLFFAIDDLVKKGFFKKGSTILAIHTGGLQGVAGFEQRWAATGKQLTEYLSLKADS